MVVLLPNAQLTVLVHTRPVPRDAHGTPLPPDTPPESRGPYPGAARELDTDNQWSLRVDTRAWPFQEGDHITDGARTWVVTDARLKAVPGHPDVDFVAVTATIDPPRVP